MTTVKLFATLIELTGRRRLEVEGIETVGELLDELERMFPGFKRELEKGFMILVNGKNIEHLNGLDTPLKEDDTVSIFPPAGGG
ncbi:ubiquitin-like small modifier protein 1 [Palaeococcus ferrophilus]|uniref:ubiquitin-like small modifier protein 1 n=1 Tax=Palaeococcus ferrophilus TaxID=83868 RepID=UPI00064E9D3C|nr:ubiquitin-like small modifier protein 1 [Palaeococcus ferrophilus]